MVCTPRFIYGKWGELAYKRQVTGDEATLRDLKKTRVSCSTYSVMVVASYLKAHMVSKHGIYVPHMIWLMKYREGQPHMWCPSPE